MNCLYNMQSFLSLKIIKIYFYILWYVSWILSINLSNITALFSFSPDKNQIELAVAHFSEGKMEILQPLKKIDTHVMIKAQHMSSYGLLKKSIFKESPINVQVILFYQIIQIRRKLHIHLLPGNVPVEEVICFNWLIILVFIPVVNMTKGQTWNNVFVMNSIYPRSINYVI